ncbi:MAG: hypothetical protein Pg6C_19100 [Treponemataceae bacterium]|nr:MAG: hypothetical protein Pg6C_18610 [Treponemataceae bacterium]GMO53026.1 MAG: hypothetical protein Pg6C_19100 [Treponemataceae bacterium]
MKRIYCALIVAALAVCGVFALPLYAQSASVSIRYYNKTVYYPEESADNPIFIHISITNTGTETLRFKLADDRMFSLDFSARTQKSAMLANTNTVLRKRTTNQTIYFREIALETGEEYSFIENVKDYLVIPEPSIYYLEAQFYPELYKSRGISSIRSNMLTLEIRPSPQGAASTAVPVYSDTMNILAPEDIPPDRVVEQTIIARQRSLWDQYFLYMDLEQMLMRDPVRERKYRVSSAAERSNMLVNYKTDLMQSRIERDIVAVPEKFSIERTLYSQSEGTVTVIEWFKYDDYREKKRYTYYVRQRDGIWRIYDYTVENMGTE